MGLFGHSNKKEEKIERLYSDRAWKKRGGLLPLVYHYVRPKGIVGRKRKKK
jgi:hypothetical protein